MMGHMRHPGKSGKFAVVCGVVAAGLLVLTAMTLAEPVFLAFLGALGLAYLAALAEILVRRRRFALLAAGAGTALALGFSLAFLSTWELAFGGQSSFLGTPLPTDDPDNYFLGAACALAATFGILFLGALWPGRGRTTAVHRPSSARRGSPQAARAAARGVANGQGRAATQRPRPPIAPRAAATPAGNQAAAPQRASVTRTPPGASPAGAKRPPSSASSSAKAAPRSGSGSASRR
ncbi:hypothetical protein QFZ35_000058 [Arthrobacter ulcerisalmonis]|nr:hypothetical protein [Arthrobacter ulcerisalmonis]